MSEHYDQTTLDSMCMTYRHDFGLLDEAGKQELRDRLRQLHYHHVRPLVEALSASRELTERWKIRCAEADGNVELLSERLAAAEAELERLKNGRSALNEEVRAILAGVPGASDSPSQDTAELISSLAVALSSVVGINRDLLVRLMEAKSKLELIRDTKKWRDEVRDASPACWFGVRIPCKNETENRVNALMSWGRLLETSRNEFRAALAAIEESEKE